MLLFSNSAASATRKYRASISRAPNSLAPKSTGRRTTLPAHCPDNSHVGLMAILYNNIGKRLHHSTKQVSNRNPSNSAAGSPQVKIWLECPCRRPSTSRLTFCRGCVKSWSTASCWIRPATLQTPSTGWWDFPRIYKLPSEVTFFWFSFHESLLQNHA